MKSVVDQVVPFFRVHVLQKHIGGKLLILLENLIAFRIVNTNGEQSYPLTHQKWWRHRQKKFVEQHLQYGLLSHFMKYTI